MHFLELARFLYVPHLAGRKFKGYFTPLCWSLRPAVSLYTPLWVFGPWNHSFLICIKIPMNLFFIWRLALMILMRGKDITWAIGRVGLKVSPVLGPNRTRCRSCNFRAQNRLPNPSNGPRNVFAPHQNHNSPRHIINRFINSYNPNKGD